MMPDEPSSSGKKDELYRVVNIRYSSKMEKRIKKVLADVPHMKPSEAYRHLLATGLALWEAKGFGELLRLQESPATYNAADAPKPRQIPLYKKLGADAKPVENVTVAAIGKPDPDRCVALSVTDDGMAGAGVVPGSVIIVDPERKPEPEDIIAIDRAGRTLLRRLVKGTSVATDNEDYKETGAYKPETLRGVVLSIIKNGAAVPITSA